MILFPTLILSLFITIALVPVLKVFALRYKAVDMPNSRKVHDNPVPRIGGLAMALGAVIPIMIWSPGNRFVDSLLLGAAVLVVFGLVDDFKELGYRSKLLGQIIAAAIIVVYGGLIIDSAGDLLPEGVVIPLWISVPLTMLAVVGVTNAINLSDGLDGLAGGISMMIFICLGIVAFRNDYTAIALLSVATIGAILGFLCFNSHPANIFMGDTGSQLLGFLAVSLAIHISQASDPLSRSFPLLLLGFPILDTLTVMVERIRKGVSPFKADKNHLHHKLMYLGASHAASVVVIYTIQFALVMSAFLLRFYSEWIIIVAYLFFCGTTILALDSHLMRRWALSWSTLFNRLINGHLRLIQKRSLVIKTCYGILELAAPLVLFVSCLTLVNIPAYVGGGALALLAGLLIVWIVHKQWLLGMLWAALFLMIPYLVFMAHIQLSDLASLSTQYGYHLTFGMLAILAVMTLKFTRRREGFKVNPFDFLVIFISFLIAGIPEIRNMVQDVSLITTKMLALFFAFEVLIGETRGQVNKLNFFMMISLATVAVKSVV
jgi:UDP-GlcNAc:undecaprenyl-phosphate/decaprenyl-phosphate GlcNAc-1-phosphate transferase